MDHYIRRESWEISELSLQNRTLTQKDLASSSTEFPVCVKMTQDHVGLVFEDLHVFKICMTTLVIT